MFKKELNAVKEALNTEVARKEFLQKWFTSPAGTAIGEDPFRRGEFAIQAGMTKEELGEWNIALHLKRFGN